MTNFIKSQILRVHLIMPKFKVLFLIKSEMTTINKANQRQLTLLVNDAFVSIKIPPET